MLKPKRKSRREVRASLVTQDVAQLVKDTENIYESIAIMSKRSRQISNSLRDELQQKIAEFSTGVDNLEEVHENREQIEISKYYERLPKPTSLAVNEFLNDKIAHYYKEEEEQGNPSL